MNAQRLPIVSDKGDRNSGRHAVLSRSTAIWTTLLTSLLLVARADAAFLYVNVSNAVPVAPYTNWLSAATNIQEAVDYASVGDTVLVSNGVYAVGGSKAFNGLLTNRVTVTKPITVQSVNGPWVTTIRGAGMTNNAAAVRCVWLTNGAALVGFTLEGGATLSQVVSSGSDIAGGGVFCNAPNATVANCVIRSNTAAGDGAAAYLGTLRNCYVTENVAPFGVGVVTLGNLLNCTVVRNIGIGVVTGNAVNSIIYFHPTTYGNSSGSFSYCCMTPKPAGLGNITNNPAFLGDGLHLAANSPCLGAGTNAAVGVDIDGLAWNSPPSIGCDDWQPNAVILGPPTFQFNTAKRQLVFDLPVAGEPPFVGSWEKDGVPIVADSVHTDVTTLNLKVDSSFPAISGSYRVSISNAHGSAGISQSVPIFIRYVDAAGTNPVVPYTNWVTAATTIQDAVDFAQPGDIVLVTNGVYASGGRPYNGGITNRVLVTQPGVMIASVSGYASTIIEGAKDPNTVSGNGPLAMRCCFLATNGVSLSGFTLRGGATKSEGAITLPNNLGGGAASLGLPWSYGSNYSSNLTDARIVNCLITSNSAVNGGGAVYLSLVNTVLAGNLATYEGGGTYNCYLTNCTVSSNSASFGGGTSNGDLYNSISINNLGAGNADWSNSWAPYVMIYTCTAPTPNVSPNTRSPFTGDIVADPQFTDSAYHLSAASPCRGTGSSLYSSGWDMAGRPWASPPSMGAWEVEDGDFVGPLAVTIAASQTNSFVGRTWNFAGLITGRASGLSWDWGDGVVSSNVSFAASHVWTNAGNYTVTFTAFNNDNPSGVSTNLAIAVLPLNPPQIELPTLTANGFDCQCLGQSNAIYTLQLATNLVPPVTWRNLQTLVCDGGPVVFTNVSGTNLMEFYRVLVR